MSIPFVCHVEWASKDPGALEKFLTELFGWQFQTFAPSYWMYLPADDSISVGIMQSEHAQAGGTPNVSIRVMDMDTALAKAEALGGAVAVPKTMMGSGAFACVAAPDGNLIGLQQL